MSQPEAFKKLRDRKAVEIKAADERATRIRKEREAEEDAAYLKIENALLPYKNCILTDDHKEKRKVRVSFVPKDRKALVYFDDVHFLTFVPERHYSSCHCEGPCEHESNTWVTLDTIQHQKKPGYTEYHCWFGCGINDLDNEDSFAESMNRMLSEFHYSGWVK